MPIESMMETYNNSYEQLMKNKEDFYDILYLYLSSEHPHPFSKIDLKTLKKLIPILMAYYFLKGKSLEPLHDFQRKTDLSSENYNQFWRCLIEVVNSQLEHKYKDLGKAWKYVLFPGLDYLKKISEDLDKYKFLM